jgi:hypothetical protein
MSGGELRLLQDLEFEATFWRSETSFRNVSNKISASPRTHSVHMSISIG